MNAGHTSPPAANRPLANARAAKQDEFYTRLEDISNELRHYRQHLRGKIVLCNCDDPFESNFFQYFALNFNALALKKLVCTSYQGSPIVNSQLPFEEFAGSKPNGREPYAVEINEVPDFNHDGAINREDIEHLLRHDKNASRPLRCDNIYGGGDFRSLECVEILKAADVVITNPPFSLFREYVAQLVEHRKQFLIIGSRNATHYQEIFKLIKDNQMWLGTGFANGNAYFKIPSENVRNFSSGVFDEKTGLVKFRNVCWFTNIDHAKRHEEIKLFKKYSPEAYPTYDNYEAIEVKKVSEIPYDYNGLMGVPDTFLDKFNPEHFELVGIPFGNLGKSLGVRKNHRGRTDIAITVNGVSRCPYSRIIIRRKT